MECPKCLSPDQDGQFCTQCGEQLKEPVAEMTGQSERRYFGRLTSQQMIAFLAGLAVTLMIAMIAFALMGRETYNLGEGQTVVVNQGEQEDPEVTALRSAAVMEPTQPEDRVVGHWMHYIQGLQIEKIGERQYRLTLNDTPYALLYDGVQYILTQGDTKYYFNLTQADRLQLNGMEGPGDGDRGKPLFEEGFLAGRVSQDGRSMPAMQVNPDAFSIIGQTYGQLAGRFGPGSLTVINDEQFIVFRGSGGNFAVAFTGDAVPLRQNGTQPAYQVMPLVNTISPGSNTDSGSENPNPEEATEGETDPSNRPENGDTPTEPEEKPLEQVEPPRDFTYRVEVPNMPTFPSNAAIATGVVWADLGFLVPDMPQQMSLSDLSSVLGVQFEVGYGSEWVNGYQFYGGSSGYFATSYQYGDHQYKLSGYGRDNLDRDKTIIFIEMIW